jgi:hypothetical protein
VLFGGLILGAAIAIVVMPKEADTVALLQEARTKLEAQQQREGSFPEPDGSGHLVLDGAVLKDAFDRPVHYRRTGAWKLATFTLRSDGYDGVAGGDDLCVTGQTKIVRFLEATISDRLEGILKALDCAE